MLFDNEQLETAQIVQYIRQFTDRIVTVVPSKWKTLTSRRCVYIWPCTKTRPYAAHWDMSPYFWIFCLLKNTVMTPLPLVQWYQMVTKWYQGGKKLELTLSTLNPSDVQVVSSDVHQVSTWPQGELSGCFCELTGIAWAQCYYGGWVWSEKVWSWMDQWLDH